MVDAVPWDDVPPEPVFERVVIPPVGVAKFTILGTGRGIWLHWLGKRSMPCLRALCPKARHSKPVYWLGYLPCLQWSDSSEYATKVRFTKVIVPLSTEKVHALRQKFGQLRGIIFDTARKTDCRKWTITKAGLPNPIGELENAFSVDLALYRCWGVRAHLNDDDDKSNLPIEPAKAEELLKEPEEGLGNCYS